jgi:hypothetical protein
MIPTVRLGTNIEEAGRELDAAVTGLLSSDAERPQLNVVLTGTELPTELIALLIKALRALREQGGAIILAAEQPAVRTTLSVTGLNRVFTQPLVPGAVPATVPVRRRTGGVAIASVALFLTALLGGSAVARAGSPPVPTADTAVILSRIAQRNPDITTYRARLHVDVAMRSFPFLRQHLDGSTFYKRPSNYEVVFDRVPFYAHGFEHIYTDIGDSSNWQKRFVITYVGERHVDGNDEIELRLVQRVRGQIDHETALVNAQTWTIDQLEYHYYNGGVVTMTQRFTDIAGYLMLVRQDAEIAIPHIRASAHADYTDYQTNVAIDNSVFTKNN